MRSRIMGDSKKAMVRTAMRKWHALIVTCGITILGGFPAYVILSGNELRRVGFQFHCWGFAQVIDSEFRGKWFWTEDPEFLKKVEDWRRNLQRYDSTIALRQAGGRIVLEYKNGRKEEFGTHSLGLTGPGSLVLFDGQHMYSENEPFSEFIERLDPKDLR